MEQRRLVMRTGRARFENPLELDSQTLALIFRYAVAVRIALFSVLADVVDAPGAFAVLCTEIAIFALAGAPAVNRRSSLVRAAPSAITSALRRPRL